MFGLKEAGLLGATVVLAGGVGYVVWVYASSSRERRSGKQPAGGGERPGKGEEQVVAVAAAPVAAASSPKSSEVRRGNVRTRTGGEDREVGRLWFYSLSSLCTALRRCNGVSWGGSCLVFLACASVQTPELVWDPGPGSGSGWSWKNQPVALLGHRQPGAGRPAERGLQRRLHQQG